MQSIRRSLSFAGLSLMAMALTFAACTDDGRSPMGPPEPPVIAPPTSGGPREGVAVQCRATLATREVVCGNPQPSAGEARAFAVTIGGQHQYVQLISSNIVLTDNPVTPEADSIFGFDVRIQNILRQPIDGRRQKMGTSDPVGSAPDPDGIRVFFTSLIGQGAAATVHNADGLGTFTTGNQEYFQYDAVLDSGAVSSPKQWQILLHEGATSFDFLLLVHTPIPFREGWIDLTPNVFGLAPGETQTLTANIRSFVGNVEPAKLIHSWSTSDPAVATVDGTGKVTAVGVGTAKITASTASGRQTGSATVNVSNAPAAADTTIGAITNVTIPASGLNDRITDLDGGARHVVADSLRTAKGGVAWMKADGTFEYLSKSGFVGQDTIHYKVTDDVTRRDARVIVNVAASKYWYVKQGASGDGRDRAPFGSFASAADSADAGDVILVLNGTSDINGPVMLEAGQSLIGQGIATPITELVNGANVTVLASGIAPTITRTDGPGAAVVLTSNNTIRGLGITASNGPAITGSSFGTLTVNQTRVNPAGPALHLTDGNLAVVVDSLSSTGSATQGLFLSGVTGSLTATRGVLRNSAGTAFAVTGGTAKIAFNGTIVNPAGLAVSIANRAAAADSIILADSISGNGDGISLTGNAGGTVTFAGVLNLTRKGIVAQNNTGGTFDFLGVLKTIDVDSTTYAGVTLASNTGASFIFRGGKLEISTNSGTGFSATGGGTVSVTGTGNTISSGTGTAVSLNGVNTTSVASNGDVFAGVVFASVNTTAATTGISLNAITGAGFRVTGTGSAGSGGSINATGNGILLTTLGATPARLDSLSVTTTGTAAAFSASGSTALTVTGLVVSATGGPALSLASSTLNGTFSKLNSTASASSAVILNTAGGTFSADSATLTGTAGGPTVAVTGGAPAFSIAAGTITNNAGRAVVVNGLTGGSVSVAAAVNSIAPGGTGILVQNNAAGVQVAFTGAKTLTTGANPAVSILADASSVLFGGGNLNITTAGAIGFQVQGAGTVQVTGLNNTISTTGAAAASIQNASSGLGGITFRTISGSGAANAIVLNTLTGAGFQVTGDGTANSGGTLSATNTAVMISAADSVHLKRVVVNAPAGVNATTFGGLRLDSATVTSTAGAALALTSTPTPGRFYTSDLAVSATNGAALSTNGVALAGTLASLSATVTTAGNAVSLVNSSGTLAATTGTIAVSGAGSTAVSVSGGSAGFVFGGNATQDANAPLLAVAGGHTGTLVFNNGTLNANNGTGVQLTAGNGTYVFNGSLDLSGGDAGIDFGALSAGTVNVTPAVGHTASIVSPMGAAIAIAGGSGNLTFNGDVTQATAAQPLLSVAGGHSGVVTFPTGTLTASNGTGLQFNDADGTYAFNGTATLSNSVVGADAGIDVIGGSGGTFTFNANATVTNPANQAITIQNGAGTLAFTYSGSLTKNNNAVTGILVQNNAGGSIAFNGDRTTETKVLSTTTAAAVSMANNGSTSIAFSGGGLNITTTSGAGFSATGSGTVQVTGAENTVAAGSGTAVNIQNVTVGASGVVFKSVSANGATQGIVLNNTGNTGGGFGVTGDGATAGSGGTITNPGQDGVRLNSARNVSLNFMNISGGSTSAGGSCSTLSASDCSAGIDMVSATSVTINRSVISNSAQMGISGQDVSGLTVTDTRVMSPGDGNDEFGMLFHNLTGVALIEDVRIDGAEDSGIWLRNTSGTLNLTMNRDTITENGINAALNVGEHGAVFEIDGTALASILVQNSEMFNLDRGAVLAQAEGTGAGSTLHLTVQNNNLHDIGSFGVEALANHTSTLNVNVSNNVIHNWVTNGVNILGAVNSNVTARVVGNTLTNPRNDDVANGIRVVQEEDSDMTTLVQGNSVSGQSFAGIIGFSRLGDLNTGAGTGAAYGTHHLTVRGNNISAPTAVNGGYGIDIQAQNEENEMCLDIGFSGSAANNVSAGTGAGVTGIRTRKANTSAGGGTNPVAFRIEGLALGAQSIANTAAHVQSFNSSTALASTSPSGGTFDGVAVNSCRDAAVVALP